MLGLAQGTDITGATFEQVLDMIVNATGNEGTKKLKHDVDSELIQKLKRDVLNEDERVLSNQIVRVHRPATFADNRMWNTHKMPIYDAEGTVTHILGISRVADDWAGIHERIWNSVPQCICIKNDEFKVIRCNRSYARRHEKSPELTCNLTDHDFWPENKFPGQAKAYREKDEEILNIVAGKTLEEAQRAWEAQASQFTEFQESQVLYDGSEHQIQTSKWPERINDSWHVVVVYSDVTAKTMEMMEYHRSTLHAIKNEILIIENARDALLMVLKKKGVLSLPELESASSFLKLGIAGFHFYLDNLRKFLLSRMGLKRIPATRVEKILRDEIWLLGEVSRGILTIHSPSLDAGVFPDECLIDLDVEFFVAAIKELFRNSRTAIYKLQKWEKGEGKEPTPGHVDVDVTFAPDTPRRLCIEVRNNGEAAVRDEVRKMLNEAWKHAQTGRGKGSEKMGLFFIRWVISGHRGTVEMTNGNEFTSFKLSLPMAECS